MTTIEDTTTTSTGAEVESDPLAGLDQSQRAELEATRSKWAEPLRVESARRPLTGMVHTLMRKGTTPPTLLRGHLAGADELTPEQVKRADQLIAEAEVEARRTAEAARRANRHASYLRNREDHYADAGYGMLRSDQNPRGMVATWLAKGPRTLMLAGAPRTGKTTAGYAITNDAHSQGVWVETWTARRLASALLPTDGDPSAWGRVTECELFLLDDLGRERVTDFWRENLQELLEVRFGKGSKLRMIVTTNTSTKAEDAYDELVERYGDPIVERILDGGGIVVFDGAPIRNLVTEW